MQRKLIFLKKAVPKQKSALRVYGQVLLRWRSRARRPAMRVKTPLSQFLRPVITARDGYLFLSSFLFPPSPSPFPPLSRLEQLPRIPARTITKLRSGRKKRFATWQISKFSYGSLRKKLSDRPSSPMANKGPEDSQHFRAVFIVRLP